MKLKSIDVDDPVGNASPNHFKNALLARTALVFFKIICIEMQ